MLTTFFPFRIPELAATISSFIKSNRGSVSYLFIYDTTTHQSLSIAAARRSVVIDSVNDLIRVHVI